MLLFAKMTPHFYSFLSNVISGYYCNCRLRGEKVDKSAVHGDPEAVAKLIRTSKKGPELHDDHSPLSPSMEDTKHEEVGEKAEGLPLRMDAVQQARSDLDAKLKNLLTPQANDGESVDKEKGNVDKCESDLILLNGCQELEQKRSPLGSISNHKAVLDINFQPAKLPRNPLPQADTNGSVGMIDARLPVIGAQKADEDWPQSSVGTRQPGDGHDDTSEVQYPFHAPVLRANSAKDGQAGVNIDTGLNPVPEAQSKQDANQQKPLEEHLSHARALFNRVVDVSDGLVLKQLEFIHSKIEATLTSGRGVSDRGIVLSMLERLILGWESQRRRACDQSQPFNSSFKDALHILAE